MLQSVFVRLFGDVGVMDFDIEVFYKIRPLSDHIKSVIKCYGSKVSPLANGVIFSREDLLQYLGKLLDVEDNRRIFIRKNQVAGTVKKVLLDDEYSLLIESLKEYNYALYGDLS